MTESMPRDWLNVRPRYVVQAMLLWAAGAIGFSVTSIVCASNGALAPAVIASATSALGWFAVGVNLVRYALVRSRG